MSFLELVSSFCVAYHMNYFYYQVEEELVIKEVKFTTKVAPLTRRLSCIGNLIK